MKPFNPEAKLLLRRTAGGALALILSVSSLPLCALAESYTVGTGEEMYNSWNTANSTTDTSHSFSMTNDIDMTGYNLSVQEGNSYQIGSARGEDHTISNVSFTQSDSQGGSVTVNADISGTDKVLEVSGSKVDVIVKGDVEQSGARTPEYAAVDVSGADVIIQGSVTAEGIAVQAGEGAGVAVTGSVTSEKDMGINAGTGSDVTVSKNVTAEDTAVFAHDSTVTVRGSVTSEEDRGVVARNDAAVVVVGDISSEETAIVANNDSTVQVWGDVTREGNGGAAEPAEFAIEATGGSDVTVKGSVTSADGGLSVLDSTVTINDNVTSEGQTMISEGSVDIGGNFISEKNSSKIGTYSGVYTKDAELTVDGKMQTPLLNVTDDSEVFIGGEVKAKIVTVGNGDPVDASDTEDTSTLRTGSIYWNKNSDTSFTGLYANGNSNTTVYGSVYGPVYASDTATVNVTGTIGHANVQEEGFTQSHLSSVWNGDPQITFRPGDTSRDTELVALCRGYFPGSKLYEHLSSIHSAMTQANRDASAKMNSGNALLVDVSKADDVLISLSKHLTPAATIGRILASCHPSTRDAVKASIKVDQYDVKMYKAALAAALKGAEQETDLNVTTESVSKIADLVTTINDWISGKNLGSLSEEQKAAVIEFLSDKALDVKEAMELLVLLGKFNKEEPELADTARELVDLLEFSKELKTTNTVLKVLLKSPEFAEYWITNYSNHVAVLDNMLSNMNLTPSQLLAAASLREEYTNKLKGTAIKIADLGIKTAMDIQKGLLSWPVQLGLILADAGAEVTGVSSKTEALANCSAMVNLLPEMYNTYENAIKRVRDGDSSDDAIQLVKTSFLVLRETLQNMALNMTKVDKNQADVYQALHDDLAYFHIGETLTGQ